MKVAGYETTPAEEMDAIQEAQTSDFRQKFSNSAVEYAIEKLEKAETLEELKITFATLGEIRKEPEVIAKKDELKAKFENLKETQAEGVENG